MTKEEALKVQESMGEIGSADKLVKLLTSDKTIEPKKRLSRHLKRMTYYRERFALQLKVIVDEMIAEYEQGIFKERFFAYETYKNVLNKTSLYLKINQTWLFLRNELDPDGKYGRFSDLVSIVRRKDGVRIMYQKDVTEQEASALKPTVVIPESEQKAEYEIKIEEFVNTASAPDELTITNVRLTEQEVTNIEASLSQLENFIFKIQSGKIWIVKIQD